MKNKPVIIAICGKSAAGKDTLKQALHYRFNTHQIPNHVLISDTTRPPRVNERDNVDYHFISPAQFRDKIINRRYIEYSRFRGWLYGTSKFNIKTNDINIGIFNPDGIKQISRYQNTYTIIPVYIKSSLLNRLWRAYHREEKFKLEYIRRAIVDAKNFKGLESFIRSNFMYYTMTDAELLKDQVSEVHQSIYETGVLQRQGRNK